MSSTLILGASSKVDRFANIAQKKLLSYGHEVSLVNPKGGLIDGVTCHTKIEDIKQEIQVVTVYIKPSLLESELEAILLLQPLLVIFNPGTENAELAKLAKNQGIEVENACTLVMLSVGSY